METNKYGHKRDNQFPKLEIIRLDNGTFSVEFREKIADELGWDEMLGLVASLTISDCKPCQQWLKDKK